MNLLEFESSRRMRREEVAAQLHRIADSLARHNDLEFVRDGLRLVVDVPDEVEFDVELELGADANELEFEIRW